MYNRNPTPTFATTTNNNPMSSMYAAIEESNQRRYQRHLEEYDRQILMLQVQLQMQQQPQLHLPRY